MKSDREFIAGIYDKAAALQDELPTAGNDDVKVSFFEKFNWSGRPYVAGLAFAAVFLLVIAGTAVGAFKGFIAGDAADNEQPQVYARSNDNIGLMMLSEPDIEFQISVTVKDIVFEENTVRIKCIAVNNSEGRFEAGEEFVVSMTRIEYENAYPDGITEGKAYTFDVYDTEEGFRVVPFIN